MRMKKVLRILCLTLAMITVLSSVAFASSARASKYLSAYHATMFETSDGNISIYFNVIAPRKMEHLGVTKINIQRYNGSYWQTEYTYRYSEMPELQGENVAKHSATVVYEPQYPSSEYRAVLTFYGADSTGSDTGVYTT